MAYTTIHLVRHGQVDNPQHLLYERLPGFHLSVRDSSPVQDDSPGIPEMFHGGSSEDPWRGQGLCREITAATCVSGILRFDILSTHCRMPR